MGVSTEHARAFPSDKALFNSGTHVDALALGAAQHLEIGDYLTAYRYADRLSRISAKQDPRLLCLRAQALIGLGEVSAAQRDFLKAFSLDPTDILVARTILQSPMSDLHGKAAWSIIKSSRGDTTATQLALNVLLKEPFGLAGNLRMDDGRLEGWISWRGDSKVVLQGRRTDGSEFAFEIDAAKDHELATSERFASDIDLRVDAILPQLEWRSGDVAIEDVSIFLRQIPMPASPAAVTGDLKPGKAADHVSRGCTVVVPIYDDFETTAACLDSLVPQMRAGHLLDVILVNDNPDDERIGNLAASVAKAQNFTLLVNPVNLGFVESVNRALTAAAPEKDILLLNSDVVLPNDCIRRLIDAAYSSEDIGTVTPLSNNGELTSFPRAFHSNPMLSPDEIAKVDSLAQIVNRDTLISLPNGIGFCLFIKRPCLDAVGALSTSYLRGYYEDVEFCLRAREAGFRNVCAANIFVGHIGSRSFKDEKQSLVTRNLKVLQSHFPDFLPDSLAFVKADPLRKSREAIEIEAAAVPLSARLLIADHCDRGPLRKRLVELMSAGVTVIVLTPTNSASGGVALKLEGEGMLQSAVFDLLDMSSRRNLVSFLQSLAVQEAEFFSRSSTSLILLQDLFEAGFLLRFLVDRAPFSVRFAEDTWECHDANAVPCELCDRVLRSSLSESSRFKDPVFHGLRAGSGQHIVSLNRMAAALFRSLDIKSVSSPHLNGSTASTAPLESTGKDLAIGRDCAIGIIYPYPLPQVERLLRLLVRMLPLQANELRIVVLGRSFDDLALMSHPKVYVAGAMQREDYSELLRCHGITKLFSPDRWGEFALVDELSLECGLPKAYFDWSFGRMETFAGDLTLDPRICDRKAVKLLSGWLQS